MSDLQPPDQPRRRFIITNGSFDNPNEPLRGTNDWNGRGRNGAFKPYAFQFTTAPARVSLDIFSRQRGRTAPIYLECGRIADFRAFLQRLIDQIDRFNTELVKAETALDNPAGFRVISTTPDEA